MSDNCASISQIVLDISGYCNLNCIMCSLKRWYPKRAAKTMPIETIKRLSGILNGLDSVSLACNCEPLLNNDIIHIIRYIKEIKPDISISFATNATLLAPALSLQLVETRLDRIEVSLDGATKEAYEKIRLGADFDKVLFNIKELAEEKKLRSSSYPQIRVISVITKINLHELIPLIELAGSFGAKDLRVNGLEPYTKETAETILYGEVVNTEYEKIFLDARKRAEDIGLELLLPSLKLMPYETCLLERCVIDSDGEVHPCSPLSYKRQFYYMGKRYVHPSVSFGNIKRDDLLKIWNSRRYKRFREGLSRGRLPRFCRNCLMKNGVLSP